MADSTTRQKDRPPAPARPRANKPQTEHTTVRIRPCNTSQISRRRAWSKSSVPGIVLQFQTTRHRNGDLGVKQHVRIVQFRMKDVTECVNERERATFRKGKVARSRSFTHSVTSFIRNWTMRTCCLTPRSPFRWRVV